MVNINIGRRAEDFKHHASPLTKSGKEKITVPQSHFRIAPPVGSQPRSRQHLLGHCNKLLEEAQNSEVAFSSTAREM